MLRLRRGDAEVFLVGDDETLNWVATRASPAIHHDGVEGRGQGWLIASGQHQVPDRRWTVHKRRYPSGEACDFLVDNEQKVIVVDLPPGPWRWLYTLRMVRNVLRWELLQKGAVYLHASCIASVGCGAVLIGPKRSGKSSLIISALRAGNVDYVTEDDLTILPAADGRLIGLGWPGTLRVRRSMLHLYPEVIDQLDGLQHPANKLEENLDPEVGVVRIFPQELQAMFGCNVLAHAPLDLIASVQWGKTDHVSHLSVAERAAILERAWDMLPERKPGTLPNPPPKGRWADQVFDPILLPHYAIGTLAAQKSLLQDMAEKIPGVSVVHSDGKFPGHLASRMLDGKGGESAVEEETDPAGGDRKSGCWDGEREG